MGIGSIKQNVEVKRHHFDGFSIIFLYSYYCYTTDGRTIPTVVNNFKRDISQAISFYLDISFLEKKINTI